MPDQQPTIKVHRHAEPERVIHAGAPQGAASEEGATEAGVGQQAARAASCEPAGANGVAAAREDAPTEAPSDADGGKNADAFHETTLADIESSSMPAVQKGIIVAAVLLVAACAAWYILFMS